MANIIFRADGDSRSGLGHVVRSLALAGMMNNDFDCVFVIRNPAKELADQILTVCKSLKVISDQIPYQQEAAFLATEMVTMNDIMVLDGYDFNTEYQKTIMQTGCKLVCIDDIHAYHFVANIVINHAISAERKKYSVEDYSLICLGFNFALLRPTFQKNAVARKKEGFNFNKNVFICLGGADPTNELQQLLIKISNDNLSRQYQYFIVVGSAYNWFKELNEFIISRDINAKVFQNLDELSIFNLMHSCAIAICSASTVSIEYLAIGGMLYLHNIAENQNEYYTKMLELTLAYPADTFPHNNMEVMANDLFKKHCDLIDGEQKNRYLSLFKNINTSSYSVN